MDNSRGNHFLPVLLSGLCLLTLFGMGGQEVLRLGMNPERVYRMSVPADVAWTDTGFDVKVGQEIYFRVSGGISLQKGNPLAYCGPEGYELETLQQPVQGENLGGLVGRIVLLVSVDVDEDTGKTTRNEIIRNFFIGAGRTVQMPIDGQLFLGINELVVADNVGRFSVEMQLLSGSSRRIRNKISQIPLP